MKKMKLRSTPAGWSFWLQWILASILGFAAGAAMGSAVAESMAPIACSEGSSDGLIDRLTNIACILPMLDVALLVVILGLASGFTQWLVLRGRIAGTGWWVLASTLGFAIAPIAAIAGVMVMSQVMSLDGNPMTAPILLGVLFGVLSAIMPWLVLRRQLARAGWWVPAHLLGSLVGGALGIVTFHAVSAIGYYDFSWAGAGAMFGAGFGAVTGITLVWLLRQPVPGK